MLSSQDLGILLSGFGQAVFEDAEDIICALPPVTSGADNLPRTADFRLAMPAKGKTYSLRLSAPLAEARLFFFYPPENLRIKRQTAAGAIIEQQMELRGAVLLDRGQDLLYFRVLAVSDDARKAVQAKLAASEEAGK
jgi:hypothetical protein